MPTNSGSDGRLSRQVTSQEDDCLNGAVVKVLSLPVEILIVY